MIRDSRALRALPDDHAARARFHAHRFLEEVRAAPRSQRAALLDGLLGAVEWVDVALEPGEVDSEQR